MGVDSMCVHTCVLYPVCVCVCVCVCVRAYSETCLVCTIEGDTKSVLIIRGILSSIRVGLCT